MMMKSHSLRKAVEAAKWMEGRREGWEGAAAKRNPTIAFSRKLNLSITDGANERSGRSASWRSLARSRSARPHPRFLHLQRDMNAAMCFEIGKREVLTTGGSRQSGWNIKIECEGHNQ